LERLVLRVEQLLRRLEHFPFLETDMVVEQGGEAGEELAVRFDQAPVQVT
jgi:hypothetical protein